VAVGDKDMTTATNPHVLGALVGEDVGVTLVADVVVGRRPRPGVRGGALVVVLAA
jgi:hypothetical protein